MEILSYVSGSGLLSINFVPRGLYMFAHNLHVGSSSALLFNILIVLDRMVSLRNTRQEEWAKNLAEEREMLSALQVWQKFTSRNLNDLVSSHHCCASCLNMIVRWPQHWSGASRSIFSIIPEKHPAWISLAVCKGSRKIVQHTAHGSSRINNLKAVFVQVRWIEGIQCVQDSSPKCKQLGP